MNTLTPEAIEMLADDYERGMIGPRRLRQYFDYLIQQLAAANARIAELEQQQFAGQTWVTFDEHMKALNKIKQMEDAIKFDFERFMEFQRRAEQAEAQNKRMREALDAANVIVGNLENETKVENKHLNAFYRAKAAVEEKP